MGSDTEVLVPGEAVGVVLALDEPLSFWGGLDPTSGNIIDRRHPQVGEKLSGRVLVMEYGRGSSSSTGVLAEAIRLGTAPVAIVLAEADIIVMLGALVANELYGLRCPVVVADRATFDTLVTGTTVAIVDDGASLHIRSPKG
jgi:predicted aconitase with swiveling domain